MEAVQMLDEDENNNNKSILLFTDGNTDIDAGTPGRTLQDSLDDVESAIQIAKEKGYKIYCIGLNQNGDVDETELAHIAQETGGDYLIATDVSSMTEFLKEYLRKLEMQILRALMNIQQTVIIIPLRLILTMRMF